MKKRSKTSKRKSQKAEARLIIDAPTQNTDIGWATGFWAPDPAVFMEIRGKRYLILRDLEVDRAMNMPKIDQVFSASELDQQIRKKRKASSRRSNVTWTDMVHHVFQQKKVKRVWVPHNFGLAYADHLRQLKYQLIIKERPFYEQRAMKTAEEIRHVRHVMRITEKALACGIDLIRKSRAKGNRLLQNGKVLTSEHVRDEIHRVLMEGGCIADLNTIVACGKYAIDPHDVGKGPLKPNQAIILDVFPRSLQSGYYGDITRTVVKGKASPKLKKMYDAVYVAVQKSARMYKPKTKVCDIYGMIHAYFEEQGFVSGVLNGRRQGFIHGVDHGVGLEIHEDPSIGSGDDILKPGHLVTLEPGLYYKGIGGVRIEDLYYITETGARRITRFPDVFEI